MLQNALIIFVRNPVLGKVKTRIAKTMGDKNALAVYMQLLGRTHAVTQKLHADKYVFYADYVNENDIWENEYYQKAIQQGDDLGERMCNAFEKSFNYGYKRVAIIGSDCPGLDESLLNYAFAALDNYDVTIGPSADGGYYLLGITRLIKQLFLHKNWSTDTVLTDTIEDLKALQLSYYLQPQLADIDTEQDWLAYQAQFK